MGRKPLWGTPPLWTLGIGLILACGVLMQQSDRWIILAAGAMILAADVGLLRVAGEKHGLFEAILSGAIAVFTIARLIESFGRSFAANHVYLILALVGSIFLLVEEFKREQSEHNGG